MHFIVFDLEFNQDPSDEKFSKTLFEIIQIGAIKCDSNLNTLADFNRFIKPSVYKNISPFITELTGITRDKLKSEKDFPEVYQSFIDFIGGTNCIFCVWGLTDMKELFKSADYYKLDQKPLPNRFINLQPHASRHLGLSPKRMLQLQNAVEALDIPKEYPFHHALYDAYYTAEILKRLNISSIQPKRYDPSYVKVKPRQSKCEIDFDRLIQQFEKMYTRAMNEDEQAMIKLAYKMGRTRQFLKKTDS